MNTALRDVHSEISPVGCVERAHRAGSTNGWRQWKTEAERGELHHIRELGRGPDSRTKSKASRWRVEQSGGLCMSVGRCYSQCFAEVEVMQWI